LSKLCRLSVLTHGSHAARRMPGFPADEPLPAGEAAKALAFRDAIGPVANIFSGPETRVRQTAELFGAGHTVDPALSDMDMGRWAGRTLAEIAASEPDALHAWTTDPDASPHGGESFSDLVRRVSAWMDVRLAGEGHSLVVTHPAVIRAMVMVVVDAPPAAFRSIDVAFHSLTDLRSDGRRWALRSFGQVLRS
jgi:broad specificity phosphatase PhoE